MTGKPSIHSSSPMSNRNLLESFARAFEGFSHVIWTQRHVRLQLFIVILVFLLCYTTGKNTTEVLFVISAVTFVLMAELFNTAIEVVVNMITDVYHPLAKIAKDVAAGGVLIASIYGFLVGCAVFLNKNTINSFMKSTHTNLTDKINDANLVVMIIVGIALLFIIVPLAKVRVGHGSILRGGAVSGHSAVSFLLCAAIAISSNFNPTASIMALVLAILVAQSRVEGKIHSLVEVLWGAAVALVLVALLILVAHPV